MFDEFIGCAGGWGGRGGDGGSGGGGAGGHSVGIGFNGTEPTIGPGVTFELGNPGPGGLGGDSNSNLRGSDGEGRTTLEFPE